MVIGLDDALKVASVVVPSTTGAIGWYWAKISSRKQQKVDLESKLMVQLDKVSDKYVMVHTKYHAMQETMIDIHSQNKELKKHISDISAQNAIQIEMIENLTKENASLQKLVKQLSEQNEMMQRELHQFREQYINPNSN